MVWHKKNHLKSFIEDAKENGYYTEEDIIKNFGEDFYSEICDIPTYHVKIRIIPCVSEANTRCHR